MTTTGRLLVYTALAAANVANAWRPVDRDGQSPAEAFLAGWPWSELAAPCPPRCSRPLRRAPGPAGSAAGPASRTPRWPRAPPQPCSRWTAWPDGAAQIYGTALVEGLGPDYADRIALPTFPGPDAAPARTPGLVRMARIRRRFALDADLPYGPHGRANHLDVWHRDDLPRDGRAPVLLQMPGGAWVTGNKQGQAYPLMSHLAERGWVCVAINYRLGPRNAWPAQIVDVKRAIAWVKDHIADYGGDPSFVAVTGGSAGGHLFSLAALTPNDPAFQPGFEDVDTTVPAAVPFYGVYDWTDRERSATGRLDAARWSAGSSSRSCATHPECSTPASPMAARTPTPRRS